MKIGLVNLDSTIKNIALEKIRLFHILRNDTVDDITPIESDFYDKVYCSSIFSNTDKSYVRNNWICGGSGFDIKSKLPNEIEIMKPKINMGFTTRGCIRKCPFCIVPEKEGKIRIEGDIYDFWDTKSKNIILFDNNILALPKHFEKICSQVKKEKLIVDFNQGLDIRLLNSKIIKIIKSISHAELRFAFDNLKDEKFVIKGIELLKKYKINRSMFYILIGFDTSFKQDLYRVELLKKLNQNVFVQKYNYNGNWERRYNEFASWCNQHRMFNAFTFEEFCEKRGFKLIYD